MTFLPSHKLLAAMALVCMVSFAEPAWAQRGGRRGGGGPGGGGFSPDQIFDRLDGNGDGKLSPDEMQQSRGFSIADIARQNGLDPGNGISRDDFNRVWAAQYQQREAGGGGFGGPPGGGFGGPPGGFGGPPGGGFGQGGGGFPAPGGEGGGFPQGGGFPAGPGGAPIGPGGGQWGGAPGGGQWGGGGGGQWGGRGGGGQWGGGGGGQWGGGGGQWGQAEGGEGGDNGGSNSRRDERPRVTFDLPGDYVAGDSDGDNQLGLNEWTEWKSRSAMRQFLSLDADGDGFLTPVELGASGSSSSRGGTGSFASAGGGRSADDDDDRSQGRDDDDDDDRGGRDSGPQGQPPDSTPAAPAAPAAPAVSLEDFEFDAASPQARLAANTFGVMDKNHNTKIETDEWQASQRIRPQFEGAGIDISGEMEQDEFVKTYLWIQSQRN